MRVLREQQGCRSAEHVSGPFLGVRSTAQRDAAPASIRLYAPLTFLAFAQGGRPSLSLEIRVLKGAACRCRP